MRLVWTFFCIVIAGLVAPAIGAETNIGPAFSHYALTLEPGERTEAAGPFYYEQQRDTEHTIGFPPFYTHVKDPDLEMEEYDIVYPVLTYDRFGSEYRWQLFQLWAWSGGQNQAGTSPKRFTLFPIYFQQRSLDTNLNYTALFPFYGTLKGRLFRDRIHFVMFPIYGQTQKRDVITDNYFFPFYHRRHGNNLTGWQLWPIYGEEQRGVNTKTNAWGDLETVGGHEKKFVIWPFYITSITGIGTENPRTEKVLLPAYTSLRSPNRDSTTVLWPLFTWTDDREKQYKEWNGPWPVVAIARGEGKRTTRFFPIYSDARSKTLQSTSYLWPIYKYNRMHADPLDRDRTRILLFLYSVVNEKNTETGKAKVRKDFWPLYTFKRDFNGNERLQVLAPLEPILPNSKSIERNYSPVWSFWRSEKNPSAEKTSQSLFWNLYRRETAPESKKFSLLFGLFQYQSGPEAKQWRLFYIPASRSQKESDHVSEHR